MAHSNLAKAANSLLTAADVNTLLSVDGSGNANISGAFTVGSIPTVNLTGGQIAFPATAVPSADPNTLDDYEEGSFTLTLRGSTGEPGTLVTWLAYYTKIGNQVTVTAISGSKNSTSYTGEITLDGLPFSEAQRGHGAVDARYIDWSTGTIPILYVDGASLALASIVDGGNLVICLHTGSATFYMGFTITYLA